MCIRDSFHTVPGGQARGRKLGGHAARALCAARAAAQGQHGVRHLVHALDAPAMYAGWASDAAVARFMRWQPHNLSLIHI